MKFATPNPSPSKRAAARQISHVTPLTKKQRLFSPNSPRTPDKFNSRFRPPGPFSQPSPSINDSLADTSMNSSLGAGDGGVSGSNTVSQSQVIDSEDVMMCSPPRIERLQLFDYPRTPISIARSSGIHVADSKLRANRPQRGMTSWNRYTDLICCILCAC